MESEEQFDGLLMTIIQKAGGIQKYFDAVYGFLYRKTDFFADATRSKSYVDTGYNGVSQQACEVILPTITCSAGYTTPKWNNNIDPNSSVYNLSDATYTATCIDTIAPVCSIFTQPTKTLISKQT
jgi:hypothetical protein